jgi:hypothetical protein
MCMMLYVLGINRRSLVRSTCTNLTLLSKALHQFNLSFCVSKDTKGETDLRDTGAISAAITLASGYISAAWIALDENKYSRFKWQSTYRSYHALLPALYVGIIVSCLRLGSHLPYLVYKIM